jgi:hypothetical protein
MSANQIHIHYEPSTGEIVGWENTDTPAQVAEHNTVTLELSHGAAMNIDAKRFKIDLATSTIREKTDVEKATDAIPKLEDIKSAVLARLRGSDVYLISDFPITDKDRANWVSYRKALRDLSKLPTTEEMLNNWPTDPNGKGNYSGPLGK